MARRHRHINWAVADQGMVSGSNVLTGILLARFLGIEGFGTYSLAWAVLLLVASIHLPLIVGSMMSIGPKQSDEETPGYYGAVIVQNLAFAVAGSVLVIISAEVIGWLVPAWGVERLALPLGAATFATVWQEFIRRYFFTIGRPAAAFAVDAARYVNQIAILLALFLLVPGIIDPALALWIVAGAAAVPAALGLRFLGPVDYRAGVMRAVAVRHYHASKWMVMSYPIEWASEYIFMFAAGTFLGTAAVGALRASQNVAAMTNILFLSLTNVVPASAARHLHEGGMAAMSRYLRGVTLTAGSATAAICLMFAVAPAFWLRLLFGEEFAQYGELVRWWALYYTVSFFALPLRSAFRAMERTRPVFTSRLMGACFALISFGILVPWLGLRGAVLGALVTKTIAVLWMWRLYRGFAKDIPDRLNDDSRTRLPAATFWR
jgi:O-antigen/teichoic acid export membrane protein